MIGRREALSEHDRGLLIANDAAGSIHKLPIRPDARRWRISLARAAAGVRVDLSFAAIDAVLICVSYTAALVLRFVDLAGITPDWWRGFLAVLPLIVSVHLAANLAFGAYGHVWEYASVEEAMRIVSAVACSAGILITGLLGYRALSTSGTGPVPLMVLVVGAGLTLGGMGAVRFRSRLFSFSRGPRGPEPLRTLVVGTGRSAADLARRPPTGDHPTEVIGFVATQPIGRPRRLAGRPVVGSVDQLTSFVDEMRVDQVVIATASGNGLVRDVVDRCMRSDVQLRIVPEMNDLLGGNGGLRDIRDVEPSDLLPRPMVAIDLERVSTIIRGRRVMITGAGGSIGSEIARQCLRFQPEAVVAVDNDETHLYDASLSWAADRAAIPVLCDIRETDSLRRVFERWRPHLVFHAAAHKHVPILEVFPEEAVKTNIIGTRNALDASMRVGVERFVLISTDKAVQPSSAMGASKSVAEMLVRAASMTNPECIFSAVRFGNVLGSRGSVVPTFQRQIKDGGPVTVSDPDMERYFMMVSEAVELVLQAAAIADSGDVLVLDMGEPVRIGDLAHRLIRLAGLVPGRDIEVRVTGPRPGEKFREALSVEPLRPSAHPKISIAASKNVSSERLRTTVDRLAVLAGEGDAGAIRELMHGLAWQDSASGRVLDLTEIEKAVPFSV